ncbi:hypothetical protein VE25_16420 [Devosia geojensis]|uniref:LysM domain-containing protein n=1 Tax=Devosia geojensis TaxID=443610 RepID=A0A0F5FPC5_9HYPH|nr:LysM peptidoglycan-binding domain-containing protein [Devosia geojensis]KKB10744.1 hypothetical protein VE25_16420 [Devosia geojensis]
MIGVLTGPSVVNCFNSPDGMGVCLRGKMADAGLVPAPAAPSAPAQAVSEAAPSEPTPAPEPAADDAPETDVVAATFGLLRAEPDGSVVIAGSGEPGSEVEVYSNDELIGRATVEPSGDWVLVPETPIPPGGSEITLAEAGKEGRAPQSFVVVIDPERDEQPLVVASEPGKASEVLQGLERPDPTIVASAPADAAAPEPTASDTDEPAEQTVSQSDDEPAAAGPQDAAAEVADLPATPETVPAEADVSEAPASEATETAAVAEPAPTAPAPATPEPSLAAAPPSVDAIEIDGDRTFFAGAGPNGATIRLYVDDAFVADVVVEGGRWLVEGGDILPGPEHVVRADLLAPGSAEVISRAEVNFRVEVPQAPVAVAEAPEPEAPASDEPATPTESEAAPASAAEPAAAAAHQQSAEGSAPAAVQPEEPTAVAETEVPTLVAEPVGDPELQRFASGRAIIRRGDNLWTIARRVYGEGIRYTTIYEANTGQIRDPDWIYPGQVFDLPEAN